MKNKILSLALAIFCVGFQFASALGEGEAFVHPETSPETLLETRPANDRARWDLQQRLRQDEPNRLRFSSHQDLDSEKDSANVNSQRLFFDDSTIDGLRQNGQITSETEGFLEIEEGKVSPLVLFNRQGNLRAQIGKGNEAGADKFLIKIKNQVRKEQAKYKKNFKVLNAQEREAEIQSFEILNTELRELTRLKEDLSAIKEKSEPGFFKKRKLINDKEKEIANVQKGIKKLISQMDTVISKLSAKESGAKDTPKGRGIGGKFITPEEEANAENAIKEGLKARTPAEIEAINRTVLPRLKVKRSGNQNPEIFLALLKAFKEEASEAFNFYDAVDSVLMQDPEITAIAKSRKAHPDSKSPEYRTDSEMLEERVQLVAQEAKSIFDQLLNQVTITDVIKEIEDKKLKIRTRKPLSDDDINALDRLAIDLAICDAYKPKYDVLQKNAQETALAEARENAKKEALEAALKAMDDEAVLVLENQEDNQRTLTEMKVTDTKIAESLTAALGKDQSAWPADVRQALEAFRALQDPISFTSDQFDSFVRERERLLAGLKSAVESALSGKEPTVAPEQVVPSVVAGEPSTVVEPEVVDKDINLFQQNERRLQIQEKLRKSKEDEASLKKILQDFEKKRKIIEEKAQQRIAQVAQ